MIKIETIKSKDLHNEEHYQFETDFKSLVKQYTPAALNIDVAYTAYLLLYKDEGDALELIIKSAITTDMEAANTKRKVTFRGLSDSVTSACIHFKPTVKAAAIRLKVVFDHYGNLNQKPNDDLSASIGNLLADMTTTYAADITAVGLGDWVTELQANNDAYVALAKARYNENAAKTPLRMDDVRVKVDASYHAIVERIHALMLINGDTAYKAFITDLNLRITHYNNLIAQRKGRAAKDDKKNDKPTT